MRFNLLAKLSILCREILISNRSISNGYPMKFLKIIALVAGVMALGVSGNAHAAEFYIEGQLGATVIENVDTATYSDTAGGVTYSNVSASIDFDTAYTGAAEIGVGGFGVDNLRLGLSVKHLKAKLNAITISGTATDGTTTLTGPASFSRADLDTIGAGSVFDNTVRIFSVTGYYDFKNDSAFTPYLGAGIGLADIENAKDKEFALNLSAGVNYAITEKIYLGVRADYHRIEGPTDKIGVNYDTIQAYSAMASVGYRF
jgi:opacity protein-like surface antigen